MSRRQLLAAIHANAKRAGIDDADRAALQERLTGRRSCREMTVPQLRLVAAAVRRRAPRARLALVPRPDAALVAMRRRARELAAAFGAGDAYLDAICRRQSGQPFAAADAAALRGVIAAVYRHGRRHGAPAS